MEEPKATEHSDQEQSMRPIVLKDNNYITETSIYHPLPPQC